MWGGSRVTGSVKGFWANVETDDRKTCNGLTCVVVRSRPAARSPSGRRSRHQDEPRRRLLGRPGRAEILAAGQPIDDKPNFYRNDYFIAGADVRGIDQDNSLHGKFDGDSIFTYKESLDTTYFGGYIGFGGEYSFGFIPGVKNVGGLYDRLGLRTFINARAGLYNADTDYDGRLRLRVRAHFNSKLSKSSDDLAFIGTVSLETRKQIGLRTSLSLWTDYEYISSVPEMHYAGRRPPDADRRRRCVRHPHHAAAEYRARLAAALPRAAEIAPAAALQSFLSATVSTA